MLDLTDVEAVLRRWTSAIFHKGIHSLYAGISESISLSRSASPSRFVSTETLSAAALLCTEENILIRLLWSRLIPKLIHAVAFLKPTLPHLVVKNSLPKYSHSHNYRAGPRSFISRFQSHQRRVFFPESHLAWHPHYSWRDVPAILQTRTQAL
jgi:hypothetical protein